MDDAPRLEPEHWVDRHGEALYRYALLRLSQPETAAELVQETFLEALRCRDAFAGRSSERTWLIGILRHRIMDHSRGRGRMRPVSEMDEAAEAAFFDAGGFWRHGPKRWGGSPSRDLERREFWEAFRGCLANLPPNLAEAFFLRELDGLESESICQLLNITPTNLWARLHRARLLLRACLENKGYGRTGSRRGD